MNAFLLMIPLFIIRFGLLRMINKEALSRAALFPPLKGREKTAYYSYQISNIFLILYLLFITVQTKQPLFLVALFVYLLGVCILIISTANFAKPKQNGINTNGIYKISRNPMYVGYFIYYLGCVLLTHSIVLLLSLIVFQISAHWIILSEERWCINKFGSEYISYMSKVRRYI